MSEVRLEAEEITIEFEELENSPHSEVFSRTGFSAIQELKCVWADRIQLAKELTGGRLTTTSLPGPPVVYITYIVPGQPYPHYEYARVESVSMKPFHTDMSNSVAGEARYAFAHLVVSYKTPDYSDPDNPELVSTERVEPSAQVLNLDGAGLYWDASQTYQLAADEAPGLIVRLEDWIFTRYNEGAINPAIFDLVGKINSTAMVSRTYGRTFVPGTLMFLGPEPTEERTSDGARKFTTSYRFTFNPWGWNNLPRRSGGSVSFQAAYNSSGNTVSFYSSADLSGIVT